GVVDGTPINLGTMERTRVVDAVHEVLRYTGKKAELKFLTHMPTGPLNRVASNQRAKELIGWSPKMKFMDGLHKTIDWYFSTKDPDKVRTYFGRMLTERGEKKAEPDAAKTEPRAPVEANSTLIVVPTPSTEEGGFSIDYVIEAARSIGRGLKAKDGYHLVVLTSTVLPGSTEYGMIPVLERESGKRCGQDFGVCYSPEFIALGQVIKDFLNPEFLLIGEQDERAGEMLASIYLAVCDNQPKIARMNLVNAELTKISVNAYVTMRISFANMVASLSEQLPGGDVDTVTGALGLDTRIGSRYLKGAVAFGGPCFPRDNQALAYLARQLGQTGALAEAVHAYNASSN